MYLLFIDAEKKCAHTYFIFTTYFAYPYIPTHSSGTGIYRDKTIADNLMYILNNETFEHSI